MIMVQAYCVVGLQRPKSDYNGLQHAAVSRVERAIYREKEALPAGQRQPTSQCRCRRRLVRLASLCNLPALAPAPAPVPARVGKGR